MQGSRFDNAFESMVERAKLRYRNMTVRRYPEKRPYGDFGEIRVLDRGVLHAFFLVRTADNFGRQGLTPQEQGDVLKAKQSVFLVIPEELDRERHDELHEVLSKQRGRRIYPIFYDQFGRVQGWGL